VGSGQRQAGRGRTLRHPGLSVSQAASSRFTPLSCRSRGQDEETPPRLSTRLTSTACRRSREPSTEEGPPERSAKDKENSSRGMLRMRCQLGAGSACFLARYRNRRPRRSWFRRLIRASRSARNSAQGLAPPPHSAHRTTASSVTGPRSSMCRAPHSEQCRIAVSVPKFICFAPASEDRVCLNQVARREPDGRHQQNVRFGFDAVAERTMASSRTTGAAALVTTSPRADTRGRRDGDLPVSLLSTSTASTATVDGVCEYRQTMAFYDAAAAAIESPAWCRSARARLRAVAAPRWTAVPRRCSHGGMVARNEGTRWALPTHETRMYVGVLA